MVLVNTDNWLQQFLDTWSGSNSEVTKKYCGDFEVIEFVKRKNARWLKDDIHVLLAGGNIKGVKRLSSTFDNGPTKSMSAYLIGEGVIGHYGLGWSFGKLDYFNVNVLGVYDEGIQERLADLQKRETRAKSLDGIIGNFHSDICLQYFRQTEADVFEPIFSVSNLPVFYTKGWVRHVTRIEICGKSYAEIGNNDDTYFVDLPWSSKGLEVSSSCESSEKFAKLDISCPIDKLEAAYEKEVELHEVVQIADLLRTDTDWLHLKEFLTFSRTRRLKSQTGDDAVREDFYSLGTQR